MKKTVPALAVLAVAVAAWFTRSPPPVTRDAEVDPVAPQEAADSHEAAPAPTLAPDAAPIAGSQGSSEGIDLKVLIEADDFCRILGIRNLDSEMAEVALDALLSAPAVSGVDYRNVEAKKKILRGLLSGDASEALEALSGDDRDSRFYRALLQGGVLQGLENGSPNPREAIRLLEGLRRGDRDNGAYSFYIAGIKEKAGFPEAEVRKDLERAMRAPRFASPERSLSTFLYGQGFASTSLKLLSSHLIADLPTADLSFGRRALEKAVRDRNDEAFLRDGVAFGRKMMAEGEASGGFGEQVVWSAVDYTTGQRLAKEAWSRLSPDRGPPQDLLQSYASLMDRDPLVHESRSLFEQPRAADRACPRDELFALHRKELEAFQERQKAPQPSPSPGKHPAPLRGFKGR